MATAAVLVPSHGLDGAVLAYIVEWAVAAGAGLAVLVRSGLFAPSAPTIRVLVIGTLAAAVLFIPGSAWLAATLATVVLIAVLAIFGTTREERIALGARVRGALRR